LTRLQRFRYRFHGRTPPPSLAPCQTAQPAGQGGSVRVRERRRSVRFILRRLAFYLVAAWFAITVNFAIPRVMPGNAVDGMLARFPTLDSHSLQALQAEFGAHAHGSLI